MRILQVITYYPPYISGMTVYVERLARALAEQGHQVTVLTSCHNPDLPSYEVSGSVTVIRIPVLLKVSKGFIMPAMIRKAYCLMRENDAVHLHLPQFDAGYLSIMARLLKKPLLATYHCSLTINKGVIHKLAQYGVELMNHIAVSLSQNVITYTMDYADHAPLLKRYRKKLKIISPPVELSHASPQKDADFQQHYNPEGRSPVIGMACRFASEKGIHVLLEALPAIIREHPRAMILFAGEHQKVPGEGPYINELAPMVSSFQAGGFWVYTGLLDPEIMSSFYKAIDLLVVASTNATESFGLVQVEALLCGKPIVASDLPGVRCPVLDTGCGRLFTPGDASSLAPAILAVLQENYHVNYRDVAAKYHPASVAARYLACLPADIYPAVQETPGSGRESCRP